MEIINIDILGCSDVRWSNTEKCIINEYAIYYSGNESIHGVAIIINREAGFEPISKRVVHIKVLSKSIWINVIQICAPTANSAEEEAKCYIMTKK